MNAAELRELGSVSLLDLDIISKFYGRDFLPYPFMLTQPSRFSSNDEYADYAAAVPDRFNNGDLAVFRRCAACYADADIRVECHVQYIDADTSSTRVVAYRFEQLGFLAKQRPTEDAIDFYELSPYLLGPAIAESAALDKPGRQTGIVIPEYAPVSNDPGPSEDFDVRDAVDTPTATEVPRSEVTAMGTAQSHWRPTRRWGLDRGKKVAVWVRIKDDGEYLYAADFSEARPVSVPNLAERIDRLIAEDVKALRQFRNG